MRVASIQFAPWDKVYNFDAGEFDLKIGEQVVVRTDLGTEVGRVIAIISGDFITQTGEKELKPILRKVNEEDLKVIKEHYKRRAEAIKYCKKSAEKHGLSMKLVDVHFSFDGGRLTFAFIADGRVDFRELVKDLTHHFQKSIRLHQMGIRDEAKIMGDFGPCGRRLCCKAHLKELISISSDLAGLQQLTHRGSDRLSGLCGRLKCCLAYEKSVYEELAKSLPPIGSVIKTPQGKGQVVGWHTLKQTVDVAIEGDKENIIEVPIQK